MSSHRNLIPTPKEQWATELKHAPGYQWKPIPHWRQDWQTDMKEWMGVSPALHSIAISLEMDYDLWKQLLLDGTLSILHTLPEDIQRRIITACSMWHAACGRFQKYQQWIYILSCMSLSPLLLSLTTAVDPWQRASFPDSRFSHQPK